MSWPTLKESVRTIDWSWYQNKGWPLRKPFDVQAFLASHPEVEAVVLRFVWPNGSPDQLYPFYYDEFAKAGKIVMGYGWPNGKVTVLQTMENWKFALDDRVPLVLISDWEESTVLSHLNKSQMSSLMNRHNDTVGAIFPLSAIVNYARGGWLDENIIPGSWFYKLSWWLAHWPYPPPDFKNQATTFAELDAMLPIDNNFTPFRGGVVKIAAEMVVGWQASSKLEIVPNGTSDGGYFKRSFLDAIYGDGPPPEPEPESPSSATLLRAIAVRIRSTASSIDDIAGAIGE